MQTHAVLTGLLRPSSKRRGKLVAPDTMTPLKKWQCNLKREKRRRRRAGRLGCRGRGSGTGMDGWRRGKRRGGGCQALNVIKDPHHPHKLNSV